MRYIHLNPLRVNLAKNMSELERCCLSGETISGCSLMSGLGTGDFVDRILNETDERLKYQMAGNKLAKSLSKYAKKIYQFT